MGNGVRLHLVVCPQMFRGGMSSDGPLDLFVSTIACSAGQQPSYYFISHINVRRNTS